MPDTAATVVDTMDPTISKVLDQQFAQGVETSRQRSARLEGAYDFYAQKSQGMFLEEGIKIGTREAVAGQRLDQDKLSSQILQARAAAMQPQAAGGAQPQPPKV